MDCLNNYRPNDFSLTKDHCTIDRSRNMEKKFRHAVVDWVNWACDKQGIDQKRTTQWIIYPDHYYKKVVFGSKHWPMHLPIGYVFISFIRSTRLEIVKLDDHKEAFDVFIQSGTIRDDMFKAFDRGEFYNLPGPASNELFTEMEDAANALYGSPDPAPKESIQKNLWQIKKA